MAEDMSLGCLSCEIFAREGTDLAGSPIHEDEDLVEPASAVGEIGGVDDKILNWQVGIGSLFANQFLYLFRSGKNANGALFGHFRTYCSQTCGKYDSPEDCLHHDGYVVE